MRSGGADSFKVTSSTVICEFHFKTSEIKVSSGYGKKTLISGAVPTVFKFKTIISKPRKEPLDRRNLASRPISSESSDSEGITTEGVGIGFPETDDEIPVECTLCAGHEDEFKRKIK